MPWKELLPMDQKVLFISDWLREKSLSITQLCQRYSISRKTGYKWIKRYQEQGVNGLYEKSRKPISHPASIPLAIRKKIIELRMQSVITPGAKKIQARLKTLYPNEQPPSKSSIYNILHTEGLVHPQRRRRRYDRYTKPLKRSTSPNELWSVDFKGQFKLLDGQWCYPLTLMDDFSRYLLGCESQNTVGTRTTIKSFEYLFRKYGLPERIRSDNGVPFSSKAVGGISRLSAWWIKLGIHPERIEPGKPQQNGKHERMHRTLKRYATHPPEHSFKLQQERFDIFKQAFNEERPHESLDFKTPKECYQSSRQPFPETISAPEYPPYYEVRTVQKNGTIHWKNNRLYVTHLLEGEQVGLEEVDDGIYAIYFYFYQLGKLDIRDKAVGSGCYLSIKV
ncbi:integrase core domain-containing protein [Cocleimonas flava]|uniref:Homeodomain-containing protein n=1 Tax=Cocleimonas flava TaxID=634765 RepID=A0A4R1F028_9GAMM|nr:DDE-type integrase/transposase/recombinase [Cocleimonas flava]TCJ87536.1 homeodomain-containing protein [Cocleimonas flava]